MDLLGGSGESDHGPSQGYGGGHYRCPAPQMAGKAAGLCHCHPRTERVRRRVIGFGDFSRIIHEGYIVPVEVQIESLKSWIKNCGSSPAGKKNPEDENRVVVRGILPPPPSVCDIIEKSGFTVAGNDIASLYRSYCNHPEITGDVGKFYIDFYRNHFPCTTLLSTSDRRAEAIMNLIRERT